MVRIVLPKFHDDEGDVLEVGEAVLAKDDVAPVVDEQGRLDIGPRADGPEHALQDLGLLLADSVHRVLAVVEVVELAREAASAVAALDKNGVDGVVHHARDHEFVVFAPRRVLEGPSETKELGVLLRCSAHIMDVRALGGLRRVFVW